MTIRTVSGAAAFAALLASPVFADGGPIPDPIPEPAPAPEPAPEPAYTPEPAPAPAGGFYASLAGGAVWLPDLGFSDFEGGSTYLTDSDTGWAGIGALGYDFGNGVRAEVEVGYRDNDGDLFASFEGNVPYADSSITALDIMANFVYTLQADSPLQPYLGAGVGMAHVNFEYDFGDLIEEDDSWAFAYQFIGGVNIPLPNTSAALFVDYRYLATAGLEIDFGGDIADNDEYRSNTVVGGFRVNF